jgi:hypothetical protein
VSGRCLLDLIIVERVQDFAERAKAERKGVAEESADLLAAVGRRISA